MVINIIPYGPKFLNSITMATVITGYTLRNVVPQDPKSLNRK
jgi:hypothetical protein